MKLSFTIGDWFSLVLHFMLLSLIAFGGAIAVASDMRRWLVDEVAWITGAQFSASIAIAQAAPGPNALFVGLLGWNVGLNTGSYGAALFGALVSTVAILLPSCVFTYFVGQWTHRNRHRLGVRAFKLGMAPIVVALMSATSWALAVGPAPQWRDWGLWVATIVASVLILRTRIHLVWLLIGGALLGWFGLV